MLSRDVKGCSGPIAWQSLCGDFCNESQHELVGTVCPNPHHTACGGDTGAGGGTGAAGDDDMGMAGMAGSAGSGGEAGMTGPTESVCQPGLVRCAGDAIETCADANRDGIYEWSLPVACASGYTCSNGICTDPSACEDECSDGATGVVTLGSNVQETSTRILVRTGGRLGLSGKSCSNGTCSAVRARMSAEKALTLR